jgi:hypothetical protein
LLETVTGLVSKTLPQPPEPFPSQIVATAMAVSGDGAVVWGVSDKFYFRYDSARQYLSFAGYTSTPPEGPRAMSVNRDGTRGCPDGL